MMTARKVTKFVAHGRFVQRLAREHGWEPGARYTNLRDVRDSAFAGKGFLDINWKRYDFGRHLAAAAQSNPLVTVARDVEDIRQLERTLREADELARHASHVVIVPKDEQLAGRLEELIPASFILGFSVPTRYGGTKIEPRHFRRAVHLLGGRPDRQRTLASQMPVVSVDCNRFTLDASFGDYFDGDKFRPHPDGGYQRCLMDSIKNIDKLWRDYSPNFEVDQTEVGQKNGQ